VESTAFATKEENGERKMINIKGKKNGTSQDQGTTEKEKKLNNMVRNACSKKKYNYSTRGFKKKNHWLCSRGREISFSTWESDT
jgi:hypothetical protein